MQLLRASLEMRRIRRRLRQASLRFGRLLWGPFLNIPELRHYNWRERRRLYRRTKLSKKARKWEVVVWYATFVACIFMANLVLEPRLQSWMRDYLGVGIPVVLYYPLSIWILGFGTLVALAWVRHQLFIVPSLRRKLPHVCSVCGYDLTGNTSGVCPECGREVAVDKKADHERPLSGQ